MPISVQIEGEGGVVEGEQWWHVCSTAMLAGEYPGRCCLRFIDPYGDAVFNQAQIPVLLEELRALQRKRAGDELASVLSELCAFVERAVDQPHTYVRFVGD